MLPVFCGIILPGSSADNRRHMRFLAIVIIAIAALSASCGRHAATKALLDRADSLMTDHPDSALTLLRTVDGSALPHGSELNARYALLLTQAEVKSFNTATDDSLISIAVDYYTSHWDMVQLLKAHFYRGSVQYKGKHYAKSLMSMFQALEMAREAGSDFWMGLASRGVADVYLDTYNGEEGVRYAQKEYEHFRRDKTQPYLNYALMDLARAYNNSCHYKESIPLCQQVIDSARKHNDPYLENAAWGTIGRSLMGMEKYVDAATAFEEVCQSEYATPEDSSYLATNYAKSGRLDKAIDLHKAIGDRDTTLQFEWLKYEIYVRIDSPHSAIKSLLKLDTEHNDIIENRISIDLTTSLLEYHSNLRKEAERSRDLSHMFIGAMITVALLITFIIYVWIKRYRQQQQEKIDNAVQMVESLSESLRTKSSECIENRKLIYTLLRSKYTLFDELCKYMQPRQNTEATNKQLYQTIMDFVNDIQGDETKTAELEELVNRHMSDLMIQFRKEVPKANDGEAKLFLFSVLGFSDTAITMFLGKKQVTATYSSRRHLKDKIKTSGCADPDRYLQYL